MSAEWKNLIERALWTAVQAFAATVVVTDVATVKAGAVAALGAVLSVLKTFASGKLDAA